MLTAALDHALDDENPAIERREAPPRRIGFSLRQDCQLMRSEAAGLALAIPTTEQRSPVGQ